MNKITAQIPRQVETTLAAQARVAEVWANQLRLWFAVAFGLAAGWSALTEASPAKYIYLALAALWLAAMAALKLRLKREFDVSLAAKTIKLDLVIITAGLLLCWWLGLFAERAAVIFFCSFPVLGLAALRYRTGLVVKTAIYAGLAYAVVAAVAASFSLLPLTLLLVMTVAATHVSSELKGLLTKAATDNVAEAYELGAKEREAELATHIQEVVLSREMHKTPELWVVAKHAAGVETGGDYYHVFETERGALLVVGDLGGTGIEAALEVAQLHVSLSQIVLRQSTLTGILEELNAALWQRYQGAKPFTCMLARWEGDELHYVNAGHLPAIRLSKQQRTQLPVTSGPVGVSEQAEFTEERIAFPTRDLLLVYTDGLYCEVTLDKDQGIAEVERMTDLFSHSEVNTLCYRVFDCSQPGRDLPKDDRTLVVARRQPMAGEKAGQEAAA